MGLKKAVVFLLMAGLMTVSCAYRFTGSDEPPFGIRRISVAMFDNKTSGTAIETLFANDLMNELARDSRWTISSAKEADAVFYGVIKSLAVESVSRGETHISLERRVIARADIRLKSKNGKILWAGDNLWASDAYRVEPDKRKTELNLRDAISHISRKMAQNVVQQLSWGAGYSPHP